MPLNASVIWSKSCRNVSSIKVVVIMVTNELLRVNFLHDSDAIHVTVVERVNPCHPLSFLIVYLYDWMSMALEGCMFLFVI